MITLHSSNVSEEVAVFGDALAVAPAGWCCSTCTTCCCCSLTPTGMLALDDDELV